MRGLDYVEFTEHIDANLVDFQYLATIKADQALINPDDDEE
jgi:hypothetical protein